MNPLSIEETMAKYQAGIEDSIQANKQAREIANYNIQQSQETNNLVEWQLNMQDILEDIKHLVRGDKLVTDDKGNTIWQIPSEEDQIFNQHGVDEIMRELTIYLNRNTILTYYPDVKSINTKMQTISNYIANLIYWKYEEFGLINLSKRKHYPSIVHGIVNTIQNVYMRALQGKEREGLKTARVVTQHEPIQAQLPQLMPQKRSLFNPKTW